MEYTLYCYIDDTCQLPIRIIECRSLYEAMNKIEDFYKDPEPEYGMISIIQKSDKERIN